MYIVFASGFGKVASFWISFVIHAWTSLSWSTAAGVSLEWNGVAAMGPTPYCEVAPLQYSVFAWSCDANVSTAL